MKCLFKLFITFLLFFYFGIVWADSGQLLFVQPAAIDKNTYAVSTHMDSMKLGFKLALKDFKTKFPQLACKPDITERFNINTDANLVEEVRRFSNLPGRKAMVGVTRTNFARLAAHAAVGTDLVGISSAAISDELRDINPNFISVGTRYQHHWKATAAGLKSLSCTPDNTLGVFAFKDIWSGYYRKSFLGDSFKRVADVDKFSLSPEISSDVRCIFLGVSAPASIKPLSKLLAMRWSGAIIGTHDWTFFSAEIRALLSDYKNRASRIYATMIWRRNEDDVSAAWSNQRFGMGLVEPIHVGVYDSTIIALNYLCRNQNVLKYDVGRWHGFGMLRNYHGMSPMGNLETVIHFVELPIVEWT